MKPMNCPGHTQIFAMERRSYRDLPIRFADFARLHRYERSGVTHGLARVRSFAQDDAHLFVTEDQIEGEIDRELRLIKEIYDIFDFKEVRIALSTRPEKRLGDDAMWDDAESALENALKKNGVDVPHQPGRGRVLRTEARVPGHRRHRPSVAARHDPARLRAAGALRARATSAPTTPSTSRS